MKINVRLLLKNKVHETLPDYNKLEGYKKYRRPIVEKMQDQYIGIFVKKLATLCEVVPIKKKFILLFIVVNIH